MILRNEIRNMYKGLGVLFVLLGFSLNAHAQKRGAVSGTIQDAENGEPIVGAVIEMILLDKSDVQKYQSSETNGKFTLAGLPYGKYKMGITYLGYEALNDTLDLNKTGLQLGVLKMRQEAKHIEGVVVEAAMRTSQKGDTLVYNAGAYKVTKDADTETLLGKMPGMKVENGSVEAQGEQVKKVLVDGKEYFGSDVTSAIKNLPAEVIDKIEVFDKLSDKAEFSGVDDGEGYKALNIVTRHGMNKGQFGKMYAGYGFNDKYNVGLSLNTFKGNRRIALIGMANNVNQQNFSTEDLLGVLGSGGGGGGGQRSRGGSGTSNFMTGWQRGVSTVKSIGVNYSNEWKEKIKLNASYFFNTQKNYVRTLTDRTYYLTDDSTQLYNALSENNSRNFNHRFNARFDYKINDRNSLMIRPSISIQSNDSDGADTSSTLLHTLDAGRILQNMLRNMASADNYGYNISNSILYMHRFGGKPGRVLSLHLNTTFNKNNRESDSYSLTRYYNPDSTSVLDQYVDNRSNGYRLSGDISYSEPISKKMQLLLNYNISYNYSDRDKRSYLLPDYIFSDSLSNTYNSGYLTQQVGPGFRYNSEKTMLVANVFYQHSSLVGDQQYPSIPEPRLSARFDNPVYRLIMNVKFNPSNTLRVRLRSSTNNPSVTQLQDVLDVSNPLFVSQGNPNLRPVYSHNLFVNYIRANVQKGRTFMAMLGGTTQSDYIANAIERADRGGYDVKDEAGNTIITLQPGGQYSRPVNLNGYWNVQGVISYGSPVKWLSSNVNFNFRTAYSSTPMIYNTQKSATNTLSYTGGIALGSNISEKLDFMFSYNFGYNIASNAKRAQNNNEYLNQVASGRVKWITWGGITLQADANYSKYTGVTDNFSEEFVILNASIGKKLFKNQRGEINVTVYDILNQNKNFARNVAENYIENVTSNVLSRYVGINLIYNLRSFGAKGNNVPSGRESGGPDSLGRPPMGPPMGGPPHGGRPF